MDYLTTYNIKNKIIITYLNFILNKLIYYQYTPNTHLKKQLKYHSSYIKNMDIRKYFNHYIMI